MAHFSKKVFNTLPFPHLAVTLPRNCRNSFMNLIVDIGNSSAKASLFDGTAMVVRKRLGDDIAAQLDDLTRDANLNACAYSVVGVANPAIIQKLNRIAPRTLRVEGQTPTPLTNDYRTPTTLGPDRLAAAVGAATIHPHKPLLIIDAGTCLTYDFVTREGHYLGGNISPGLGMRLRALHEQTALLPLVSAEGPWPQPGRDTETAIRSGVMHGMLYEMRGYVEDFLHDVSDGHIFLTGGNAFRFDLPQAEHSETLVETGLNRILLYNI